MRVRPPEDVEIEVADLGDERVALITWPVPARPVLSATEEQIVCEIAMGRSNAQIAAKRGRSRHTVANQVAGLLKKFGVSSRHELVLALTRRA